MRRHKQDGSGDERALKAKEGAEWGEIVKQRILSYRYRPLDTGSTVTARTVQSKPVLSVAMSSSNWTIKCHVGWLGQLIP